MSLLVYKISNYSYTAEREQYRTICQSLKKRYSGSKDLCVFVANWTTADHELDGLIIKEDALIAIEFKNYGGKIIATENGDWKKADGTVIRGGSRKNPYKQAQLNKIYLRDGLRSSGFVSSKNLKHIASIIVFNEPIELDDKGISRQTRSWLHICDNDHFIEKVEDITSSETYFSEKDIFSLISNLNFEMGGDAIDKDYSDDILSSDVDLNDSEDPIPVLAPAAPAPVALTISNLCTTNREITLLNTLPGINLSQLPAFIGIDFSEFFNFLY